MISAQYALPVVVLALLALVPTVLHTYIGMTCDDGRQAEAVATDLADMTAMPTNRRPEWGKALFDSDDWTERTYAARGRRPITLLVVRSYDAKRLYHHPEIGAARGTSFSSKEIIRVAELPEMPVHVLRGPGEAETDLALYALHYGNRFIGNPYLFQLQRSGDLLVSGRKPMTLFFVHTTISRLEAVDGGAPARLLTAAVRTFLNQSPGVNTTNRTTNELGGCFW
ncbi:MAG: hypothetical protein HY695_22725 [Deltaproteobacteria bacterium]|nr:hypothetical protein [Deltaproteobacteria bacterium]